MQRIDLTYNEIKRANVPSLCGMLAGKLALSCVELNGNALGGDDVDAVRSAIDANAGAAGGEAVVGDTDEMEDPDEADDGDDDDDGEGGDEDGGDDDDDDDNDEDDDGGDMDAEEEDALVASVAAKLNL